MNQRFLWLALGALGLVIGCGGDGTSTTSTTSGGGGSTSTATGSGGGGGMGTSTVTSTGAGGGTGTSTATSTGAGGGASGAECNSCVDQNHVFGLGTKCSMELSSCITNATCKTWFQCVQGCQATNFTTGCFTACDQAASSVSAMYLPFYACVCPVCTTECAPACP